MCTLVLIFADGRVHVGCSHVWQISDDTFLMHIASMLWLTSKHLINPPGCVSDDYATDPAKRPLLNASLHVTGNAPCQGKTHQVYADVGFTNMARGSLLTVRNGAKDQSERKSRSVTMQVKCVEYDGTYETVALTQCPGCTPCTYSAQTVPSWQAFLWKSHAAAPPAVALSCSCKCLPLVSK